MTTAEIYDRVADGRLSPEDGVRMLEENRKERERQRGAASGIPGWLRVLGVVTLAILFAPVFHGRQ